MDIKTDAQFYILREKGTEPARSGVYDKFYPAPGEGYFACSGCESPLYSAAAKFDSGCGWPAFDKCFHGSVKVWWDTCCNQLPVQIHRLLLHAPQAQCTLGAHSQKLE